MMIPDKNFRMKRSTKVILGLMKGSKEDRNQFKKMMIDAQLSEESAKRAMLKSKDQKFSYGSKDKESVSE